MSNPDRYDVVDPSDYECWDHWEHPEGPSMYSHLPEGLPYFTNVTSLGNSSSSTVQRDENTIKDIEKRIDKLDQTILDINMANFGKSTDGIRAEVNGLREQIEQAKLEIRKLESSPDDDLVSGSEESEESEESEAHWQREELDEQNQEANELNSTKQENGEVDAERRGKENENENDVFNDGLDEAMDDALEDQAENMRLKSQNDKLMHRVDELNEELDIIRPALSVVELNLAYTESSRKAIEEELRELKSRQSVKAEMRDTQTLEEKLADAQDKCDKKIAKAMANCKKKEAEEEACRKKTAEEAEAYREQLKETKAFREKLVVEADAGLEAFRVEFAADAEAYRNKVKADWEVEAKATREKLKADVEAYRAKLDENGNAFRDKVKADAEAYRAKVDENGNAYRDKIRADSIKYGEEVEAKAKAHYKSIEAELQVLKNTQAAQAKSDKDLDKTVQQLQQELAYAREYYERTQRELQELPRYKAQAERTEKLVQQLANDSNTTEVELQELRRIRDEKFEADKDRDETVQQLQQELVYAKEYYERTQRELQELPGYKAQAEETEKREQQLAKDRNTIEAELQELRRMRDGKVEADKIQTEHIQKLQQKSEHEAIKSKMTEEELQELRGLRDKKAEADKVQAKDTQKLKQEVETLRKQLSETRTRAADPEILPIAAEDSAPAGKHLKQEIEKLGREKEAYKNQLTKAQQTCDERKAELEETTKLKVANATSVEKQKDRINGLEQTIAEKDRIILRLRNDTSARSREQLGQDIEELRAELAVVRESEKEQRSLNDEKSRQKAGQEEYIERTDGALKIAKEELAAKEKHYEKMVDNLKKTERRLQLQEKEFVEVNARAEKSKKMLKDAYGQLTAFTTEIKSIEDVKRELAAVKEEKKTLEGELSPLQKTFDDTRAEYIKLNDEFDAMRKKKEAADREVKARQEVDGGSTKSALKETAGELAVPNSNLQATERIELQSLLTKPTQSSQQQDTELTRTISSDLASELMSAAGDESDSSDDEQVPGTPAKKIPSRLIDTGLAPESGSKNRDAVSPDNKDAGRAEDGVDGFVKTLNHTKDWSSTGAKASTSYNNSNDAPTFDPNATKEKPLRTVACSDANGGAHNIPQEEADNILSVASLRKHDEQQKAIQIGRVLPAEYASVKADKRQPAMGGRARKSPGSALKTITAGHSTSVGQASKTPILDKQVESSKIGGAAKSSDVAKKPHIIGSGNAGGVTSPNSISNAAPKIGNKDGGLTQKPTLHRILWATSPKQSSSFTAILPSSSSEYTIPTKWAVLIFLIWLLTMFWASTSIADAKKERNMWLAANDMTRRAVISHRYGLDVGRGIFGLGTGMEILGWFWRDSLDGLQAGRLFG